MGALSWVSVHVHMVLAPSCSPYCDIIPYKKLSYVVDAAKKDSFSPVLT